MVLFHLYMKEVIKYKKDNYKKKYSLKEIDDFHDYFCNKYNTNNIEFEKLMKKTQSEDSIQLFLGE